MSVSVSLGKHYEAFIQKEIESGRFGNVSEIVRAGLRLLEDQQRLREMHERDLLAKLEEGRNSPRAGSGEEVVARGKARLMKKYGAKKK